MLSIVIPAHNEENSIGKCLTALVKQKTKKKFEVIVVDNNSDDKTAEIAGTFAHKLNLKVILERQKGRGMARYTGFKHAKGDSIMSTDADVIVPDDWVEKMSGALQDPKIVAVAGACFLPDVPQMKNLAFTAVNPFIREAYNLGFGHYYLPGYNFGIKRDAYEKSGGFNKKLNTHEDFDLGFKVSQIGKIKYMPSIVVAASGRRFKAGLIHAFGEYVLPFIDYYYFHKESIHLRDVR